MPRYNYHRTFAWIPTRMDSERLVWLTHYYIRPSSNGVGILLTKLEYILESYRD